MVFSLKSDSTLFKTLIIFFVLISLITFILNPWRLKCCSSPHSNLFSSHSNNDQSTFTNSIPTNLDHIAFGLLGSEDAYHHRKPYIESWWRPHQTKGYLYLDVNPSGDLLPWSDSSPPYKVSEDITQFLQETKARAPVMIRMVRGIMEVFRQVEKDEGKNLRWLVMGDDDSVFFVDNIVEVLGSYDHTKYYYIGGQSEFVSSNYWFSFNQGFGGAGFMLSYPLAKALARDMESCLRRYAHLSSADLITMVCIADIGVNLTPHKGIHQIDLHGDISGFLSSHPNTPLLSLHHFDAVDPIFPDMDRSRSTRHLMTAASFDQSRILQQTICHHKPLNWSLSISWGYSVNIYENTIPRSELQKPIETFEPWSGSKDELAKPLYMFNTRLPSDDPCEMPHVFYFKSARRSWMGDVVITTYVRAKPRGLRACLAGGNHTADFVSEVRVVSSATKRKQMGRCECCGVTSVDGIKLELRIRECEADEIIA